MDPTTELYNAMQLAFDHFNETLFDNSLPKVLFTSQRQQGIMGYFAPNRWTSISGKQCHEIAINPLYVGRATLIELMQTLVHEMVHCWQTCYGKPSRKSYHNKEWSNKMITIGLMPSATGYPGGAVVGQKMSDYPKPNGKFIYSCEKLLQDKNFKLPWIDRFARVTKTKHIDNEESPVGSTTLDLIGIELTSANQLTTKLDELFGMESFAPIDLQAEKKVKSKYTCNKCQLNVWGKPKLRLRCDSCNLELLES